MSMRKFSNTQIQKYKVLERLYIYVINFKYGVRPIIYFEGGTQFQCMPSLCKAVYKGEYGYHPWSETQYF